MKVDFRNPIKAIFISQSIGGGFLLDFSSAFGRYMTNYLTFVV